MDTMVELHNIEFSHSNDVSRTSSPAINHLGKTAAGKMRNPANSVSARRADGDPEGGG